MTLKPTVTAEERDTLSPDLQKIYVENNGQWVLDAEVDAHPRVRALKKAYDSTKEELSKIRAAVPSDETDDKGNTASVEERLTNTLKQRDSLIAQHRDDATQWKQRAQQATLQYESALAASKLKVKAPQVLLLKLQSVSAVDKNGKVFVKDSQGQPMLRRGAIREDDYLPLSDYAETLRDDPDFSYIFEPNGAKGSNAQESKPTNPALRKGSLQDVNGMQVWVSQG